MDYYGYEYRMYTIDATQRKTYDGAQHFCYSLGAGWDLVPHWDSYGYDAMKKICAANSFTCWFKKQEAYLALCPLIDAKGELQMQGCMQDVRFVCRKKGY